MSDFKTNFAYYVRKFLTKILTPATGFLQQQELQPVSSDLSLSKKAINYIIRWLSWCCHGAITLAYPHMRYNPIQNRYQEAQWEWTSKILNIPPKQLCEIGTAFLIKQQCDISKITTVSIPEQISFTILLCFYHHLNYFQHCLNSIQEALNQAPHTQLEILLINDDPSIDLSSFLANLDFSLRQKIVLRTHTKNQGISNSLNEAIRYAHGEWLIYLDCDDLLEATVFPVLEKTIREHPNTRFISSRAADIDTDGDFLFWRLRAEQPYELIKNNFAGHLKVIKKELHEHLGLFKQKFEGCQDYEFALRTAINEPLLFIPNYLYRYRWHHDTQTVSQNERQNLTAMRVRQSYILTMYWLTHGVEMLEWNIIGPEAASWKKHLSSTPEHSLTQIFDHPRNEEEGAKVDEVRQEQDCDLTSTNSYRLRSNSSLTRHSGAFPTSAVEGEFGLLPQTRYQVTLEAEIAYTPLHWKLLLAELASIIIDRYREQDHNMLISIRLF